MERQERNLEELIVDATLAEGREYSSPSEAMDEAAEYFECAFVDVAFAEAGEFTESACRPTVKERHDTGHTLHH